MYYGQLYPPSGRVRTVIGDQQSVQECYQSSLETRREDITLEAIPLPEVLDEYTDSWDLRLSKDNERFIPT